MSEFISKGALLKEVSTSKFSEDAKKMKIEYDSEMDGFFQGYIEGMLMFMPTITEQEIREKAIDEFAEALHKKCDCMIQSEWNNGVAPVSWANAYADFKDDIDEIAEQMKGGVE